MKDVEQRIAELMDNETFLKDMLDAKNPDELVEVYNRNGLVLGDDISAEEAFAAVQAEKEKAINGDELSEEDLDAVAGGVGKVYFAFKIAKGCAYMAASGSVGSVLLTVGGIAAIGLATYAAGRYISKHI